MQLPRWNWRTAPDCSAKLELLLRRAQVIGQFKVNWNNLGDAESCLLVTAIVPEWKRCGACQMHSRKHTSIMRSGTGTPSTVAMAKIFLTCSKPQVAKQ